MRPGWRRAWQVRRTRNFAAVSALVLAACGSPAIAVDGGPLQVNPRNGWKAFEVISIGDDPQGDGFTYAMPGTFDGLGAFLPNASTLRLMVNHELADASVSEVTLNLANFKTAITNVRNTGNTGGGSFVSAARQAYGQWSDNGGGSFTATVDATTTAFQRFCSGQLHPANTFGVNRGFVDNIYMTGEEVTGGRMFALDVANRDYYRLGSATIGASPGGIGGMPSGPWENAALLDTGEANHVALLLSPDGNPTTPTNAVAQLYVGVKGKDFNGNASTSFLARNGLAYGSTYYLNDTLPSSGTSLDGTFDTTIAGGLVSAKLEDVDTNPNDPTQAVMGVQETGLFTFDFALSFNGTGDTFNAANSGFSITKIQDHANDTDGLFGDADNVDWTKTTTLNDITYLNGLIFVNEDSGTNNGETWMMKPDGSGLVLIGDTFGIANATETSGILDISELVGYLPGSVLLTSNQGTTASLTVLINPDATLIPEPASLAVAGIGSGMLLLRRRARRTCPADTVGDDPQR